MPVSVSSQRDPFRGPTPTKTSEPPKIELRVPQARLLAALVPRNPASYWTEWPLLNRAALAVRAGYTAISGSVTRALNGVRAGSSSGPPQQGLLTLGLVEEIELDIDGVRELNYRATLRGVEVYLAYITKRGGALPEHRDKAISVNTTRGYENPHL